MSRRLLFLTALSAFPWCDRAWAEDAAPARLKTEIVTKPPILVGQRTTIRVVLATTTIFSSAPAFEIPSIPGAVLMHVEDRPVLGTEDFDGTSYTTQTHELAFFGMRPARFTIPAFDIRFESPPMFGQKPVERRVKVPELTIEATLPREAAGLQSLTCTTELNVNETWTPTPKVTARVGDSFTRTVTLKAPGVPAMALPPLRFDGTSSLRAYSKPATVNDQSERGEFSGIRVEAVTYVCDRPGVARLPAVVIPWWNLDEGKLMKVTLPAVSMEIEAAASSLPESGTSKLSSRRPPWGVLLALVFLALLGIALWRRRHDIVSAWNRRRAARDATESGRHRALLEACDHSDPVAAWNALMAWLDVRKGATGLATVESDLSEALLNPAAAAELNELESALVQHSPWSGTPLKRLLQAARPSHSPAHDNRFALPTLNPVQ
jgi:hypothetical protein